MLARWYNDVANDINTIPRISKTMRIKSNWCCKFNPSKQLVKYWTKMLNGVINNKSNKNLEIFRFLSIKETRQLTAKPSKKITKLKLLIEKQLLILTADAVQTALPRLVEIDKAWPVAVISNERT